MAMTINCVGGGPASLYFAALYKKAHPEAKITVFERNPADVTWGFGVVFSDATMQNFKDADEPTWKAITDSFVHWDDIDCFVKGEKFTSTGHGFAGMQRLKLLQILEARAKELGVEVRHNVEIADFDKLEAESDLLIAGDGIASWIRKKYEAEFETDLVMRPNKFVWLGSTKGFDAFTFYFKEDAAGLWRVHAYQYMPGVSTFILECTEETWKRAGLDKATEADTVAYGENLFKEELGNNRLLTNNSVWRTFPRVKNGKYFHKNIVLMGDALHSAHFSIGSGTKLAMEDAISLATVLNGKFDGDMQAALQAFQDDRQPAVDSLQRSAQVSMEWFEEAERYYHEQEPIQFTYSMLTRSLRINHDNLKLRDPAFVENYDKWFAERAYAAAGRPMPASGKVPPPIFTPFKLRDLVLENRVMMSPMCMYSAEDGTVNDWHLVHLGSRAVGGVGLIMAEGTGVSADGRITPGCAGMYKPEHVAAWKRVTDFVHANSHTKIGIQLCHAGRKSSTKLLWEGYDVPLDEGNWEIIAPSPLPYKPINQVPREMTRADMDRVRDDFVRAVGMAEEAGFDIIEMHAAHGYLLSTFLSPLTNVRTDEYGGSLENRLRYPLEVFNAMRAAWPAHKPMSVRISAMDWAEGGITYVDAIEIAKAFKAAGVDIMDISTGQVVAHEKPVFGRLWQTPFSDRVRHDAKTATMNVGNIQTFGDANGVIAAGRADIVTIARMHLADPYWTLHAAYEYGWEMPVPKQYGTVRVGRYTPRWS